MAAAEAVTTPRRSVPGDAAERQLRMVVKRFEALKADIERLSALLPDNRGLSDFLPMMLADCDDMRAHIERSVAPASPTARSGSPGEAA